MIITLSYHNFVIAKRFVYDNFDCRVSIASDGSVGEEHATDRTAVGPDEVSLRTQVSHRSETLSGQLDRVTKLVSVHVYMCGVSLAYMYLRHVSPTILQYRILFDVGNGDNPKAFLLLHASPTPCSPIMP